eukprot:TRINITY_DN24990_c0_g1_i1.p1 TRINITY_DN24990_c0_g1~~TRINITY_DN24990_c0_g1_i1.p1  ORF type:complete len:909 (+),score=256.18 TRINITY_DN24990_c0_g1_i1:84-2810(+)
MRSLVPKFLRNPRKSERGDPRDAEAGRPGGTRSASLPARASRQSVDSRQSADPSAAGSDSPSTPLEPGASRARARAPTRYHLEHLTNPWVLAFVVVRFDLELGQVIDKVVPEGAFTPEQQKEICHLSFPDSNSRLVNDTCYTIKLRRRGCKFKYNYGYVYFRQKRDVSVHRGYVQESLVLISRWPFVSLLEAILQSVARPFFSMCPVSPTPIHHNIPATVTALPLDASAPNFTASSPTASSPRTSASVSPPVSPRRKFSFLFTPAASSSPSALARSGAVAASLAVGMAAVVATSTWDVEPRYQLLYDALCELNTWSPPDSCASYNLTFMGGDYEWRAPKFTVTTRTTTVNCSNKDLINPKDRRVASVVHQNQWIVSPTDGRLQDKLGGHQHVFAEVPLWSTFQTCLQRLWQLWELALLSEPLCVLSTSPTVSSSATLAVVSLIHPITSCSDFRPYYSVQDPDCKLVALLGNREKSEADIPAALQGPVASMTGKGPIIGATNPYFVKVFHGWPHLLTLDAHQAATPREASPVPLASPPPMKARPLQKKRKNSREKLLTEFKEMFSTTRTYVVNHAADHIKPVLDQLIDKAHPMADRINTGILRHHFVKMTDAFLLPLLRCFEERWDADTRLFVLKHHGAKEMYTRAVFKKYLREGATPYDKKLFRRDQKAVLQLYDRVIEGCHFTNWVEERITERYKLDLQTCDITAAVAPLGESQRIELFMILCGDLVQEERKLARDPAFVGLLQRRLTAILEGLPAAMHKPLLRRHYRSALGEDTPLPMWAVERDPLSREQPSRFGREQNSSIGQRAMSDPTPATQRSNTPDHTPCGFSDGSRSTSFDSSRSPSPQYLRTPHQKAGDQSVHSVLSAGGVLSAGDSVDPSCDDDITRSPSPLLEPIPNPALPAVEAEV